MTSTHREFITATGAFATLGTGLSLAQERESANGLLRQVDTISWYYELQGSGPTVVLIPSGEGDCGSFDKVAGYLSPQFRGSLKLHNPPPTGFVQQGLCGGSVDW